MRDLILSLETNVLDLLTFEAGSFYVIDKVYIDFKRLYRLHQQGAFFVTRDKVNMRFNRMYSRPVDKTTGVKYDQTGKLETYYPRRDYPEKLRRIKYYDPETRKEFIFLCNNMDLAPEEIALLYKKTLGSRIILQVDETTFKDKILLGNNFECSKNPNVLCDHCLLSCCHNW